MKLVWSLVILLAIGALARDVPTGPSPVSTRCSAFGSLRIRVVGTGRCKGIANAKCTAVASAVDDFKGAYDVWWGTGTPCESKKIKLAAQAVAHACASVYAETLAQVKCVGAGGFACGYALGEGTAFAQALAEAVAQAAVDVSSVTSDAFCVSDVAAVAGAIAEAAAEAHSHACVKGTGSQEDYQSAFVLSVQEAIADAYVKASASTCDAQGQSAATSLCYGEAGGKTKGAVIAAYTEKGKGKGSGGSLEICPDGLGHCCDPVYKKVTCNCKDANCKGLWRVGPGKTWVKGSQRCLCPRK